METIHFKGMPMHTYGSLPRPQAVAPEFKLTTKDLATVTQADFAGKRIVLTTFPSLDTPVCAMQVRRFNKDAATLPDTQVICVSMDLPFAMGRFCAANDIENVIAASAFRSPSFAQDYGLLIVDGPLEGLLARAVIVIDTDGRIMYSQLVDEVTNEPDYDAVLKVLKK